MNKKNLILCFSSIRPIQYDPEMLKSREKNYDLALEWLLNSLPTNWDLIYNDNTLSDLSDIDNESLRERLKNDRIKLILHKNNEGIQNKGAGEHDMCRKCFLEVDPNDYNWVTYFTARHIIPNSSYFDKLENEWFEYDSIMSNPVFNYLNNYENNLPLNKDCYTDMLFSLKSYVFREFINHIDVQFLKMYHKNSEGHLYDFIKNSNYNTLELDRLGILRNDHQSFGWHLA